MVFRAEFDHLFDSIQTGTKMLIQVCDSVRNSDRFRKVLLYALKLGNALNTDGSGEEVTAITLDSILKLVEVSHKNSFSGHACVPHSSVFLPKLIVGKSL